MPGAFVPLEVRRGNPNDPIAIRSCLGFAILDRTGDGAQDSAMMFTIFKQQPMTCLSIAKLNVSRSQSLTSSCRLKTGMLNGLLIAQSSS